MKLSLKHLIGYNLETKDKVKGKVLDFFFDEERWVIRYMEADQGKILPNKKVLIPRVFLDEPDGEHSNFKVNMSRDDFENCPATEDNKPVSREYESRLLSHLQMKNYWAVAPPSPTGMTYPVRPIEPPKVQIKEENIDTTLRSFNEVLGYRVYTKDGNYGNIDDIIIDDTDWQILYFVITDGNLLGEMKVMFPISWIDEISYKNQNVKLNIDSGELQKAPDFNPDAPVNTEYEKKVYDYYGRLLKK